MREERALPVLTTLLTENVFAQQQLLDWEQRIIWQQTGWRYDAWLYDVIRLLGAWGDPDLAPYLRHALEEILRLGEREPGVWGKPELRPWFYSTENEQQFACQWERVQIDILSNRNLPAVRPLRISWGRLSDRERADIMKLDPASQPDLYWTLVLANEIARNRWDDTIETEYDFEHFRRVADELCDYLQGQSRPSDIQRLPLAKSLRLLSGGSIALRFRELVYSLKDFEIWRAAEDNDKDIADVVASRPNSPSAIVIDLLSVETEEERVALTTRALAALWKAARESYNNALRDIDEPDLRAPIIIVIDEAHNIIPSKRTSPGLERLAGDIARVAAEGRKFGLFLLVITQRPRKVDANVLSECDGLFLMKMTNDTDLQYACEVFGFLQTAVVTRAKDLKVGELFLWTARRH